MCHLGSKWSLPLSLQVTVTLVVAAVALFAHCYAVYVRIFIFRSLPTEGRGVREESQVLGPLLRQTWMALLLANGNQSFYIGYCKSVQRR